MPTAPVVNRGRIDTVTDTTNIRLDVSDVIDQLSPTEVPTISLIGKDSLHTACEQVKHEWLEDQLRPRSGTLGAAYTLGSGTIQLAATQGTYLVPNDLILLEAKDLVFQINAGPPSSDTLTVTLLRGTDANVATATNWRKVAHGAQEAGLARTDVAKTVVSRPYNYTQILKDWALVSGTMEVIRRYGYISERAYQEEKIIKQLMIDFESNLIYGVRYYTAGPPRVSTAGGLYEYIWQASNSAATAYPTVINLAGAYLDEAALNNGLQQVWAQGGMPDTIMVNGFNRRRLTGFATPRIRTEIDSLKGGGTYDVYESDFGDLEIYLNRWLRAGDVLILTRDEIGLGPLQGRQLSSRQLPVTGDFTWYELLGEYTMEVHKPQNSHAWIYNTATA